LGVGRRAGDDRINFRFSLSPASELPTYGQDSTKEATAEERAACYVIDFASL